MSEIDVYAYGVVASSTLHLLDHSFPPPDGYGEITTTRSMTGGEALNSAIVASRLGLSVQLDGNWLGDTTEGRRLLEIIRQHEIDARRLRLKKDYVGPREIVFAAGGTRTIFGNYAQLLSTKRKWNAPVKEDIARARIACVDPPFGSESTAVGRYARELGIPFVSIDCPYEHELATGAAVVVVSGEFRNRQYASGALAELFSEYQQRAAGLVIFTVGDEPILYGRRGGEVRRFPAFRANVVDSAGAGDSFRAGVIFGLLQRWADEEIVQYASALAALVCETFPGVLNSPPHEDVLARIRERKEQGD